MSSQLKQLKAEYRKGKKDVSDDTEALFYRQLKESGLHPQILKQARKNGILNLSGRGIVEMPDIVWNLNCLSQDEVDALSLGMDSSSDNHWWEYVGLTKLILASNSLQVISPEIKNHQALIVLDLHDNCLISLPDTVSELNNLTKLNISRNKFNQLPVCVYKLKMLRQLMVQHNSIGFLDKGIGDLSLLEELDVSHNDLQEIPPDIGFLSHITVFNASNNKLSSVPLEIGDMSGLRRLELSNNKIGNLPEHLQNLLHLEQLYLQHNKLVSMPMLLRGSDLKEIHCGFNCIEQLPSEFFDVLTGVKLLDFRDNKLSEIPDSIAAVQSLEMLHLSNNNLSSLPYTLGTLPHLKVLSLEGNPLKSIRRDIVQRGTVHLLKWLCSRIQEPVQLASASEKEPHCLPETFSIADKSTLKSTKALKCSNKGLTVVPDVMIEDATDAGVTAVDFSKNNLTSLSEKMKDILPKLSELNLGFNKLQCLPSFISLSSCLQYLDIRNNKIQDLPSEMCEMNQLKEINLSSNRFQKLPGVLYLLEKLEIILASDNQISEIDVPGLAKLSLLAVLDLHNNSIKVVPPELGTLANLRSLLLDGNLFRNPRAAILAKGTNELLQYLRNQIRQTDQT